jgi:YgiT-type zinc finger domain-containing protein
MKNFMKKEVDFSKGVRGRYAGQSFAVVGDETVSVNPLKYEDCSCRNTKREKVTQEISLAGKKVLLKDVTAWVCQDCREPFFNGKFLLKLEKKLLQSRRKAEKKWIRAARRRLPTFPEKYFKLHYSRDVESLFVQLSREPIETSRHDLEKDIIFNFDARGETVSFEILNLRLNRFL